VYQFISTHAALLRINGINVQIPKNIIQIQQKPAILLKLTNKLVIGQSSALDPLAFDYEIALGDTSVSMDEFSLLVKAKCPLVRVKNKWVEFNLDDGQKVLDIISGRRGNTLRDVAAIGVTAALDNIETRVIYKGLSYTSIAETIMQDLPEVKSYINGKLRDYQIKGLSWLSLLQRLGYGALLADDMGLGKTVQVIALLTLTKEQHAKPALIICPTSVIGNWQAELQRFAPQLRITIHHGSDRSNGPPLTKKLPCTDVFITSYALSWRDSEYLTAVQWGIMIIDEAQNIKNPFTKQSKHIKKIQATYRIALTGTPVENRLSDLWSIMDFLNPGYFPDWTKFKERFAKPIEKENDERKSTLLRSAVGPFMLRRLKTDKSIITELPDKIESVEWCTLTTEQATLYQAIVDETIAAVKNDPDQKMAILAAITKLKQICNHPSNFLKDSKELGDRSGKIERLLELVDMILEANESCLIFSQYTEMTGLLYTNMKKHFNVPVLHLHGSLSRKERDRIVSEFQNTGTKVLILSLKVGGIGLNLTNANHVIHFDRWWNPAVENQASDRTYRIGQNKTVFVYKLITKGTIEERIDEIICRKRQLSQSIIDNMILDMKPDALREFLSFRKDNL
jgi:SNF2 family DNA or RNA helicase